MKRDRLPAARGYTLVVVVVVLTILLLLGAGAIRAAGSGAQGAVAHHSAVSVTACARAARDAVKSQLRFGGAMEFESLEFVGPDGNRVQTIEPGHAHSSGTVESVEFLTESHLGTGRSPQLHPRISNDILPARQRSSSAVRIVAICRDEMDREQEVEFLLRYGL